ncbi:hypothetical protein SKAU_G00335760 [Synaphobranchus kaupii]|uniref:Uncharacterized protein n=1 Tax=Synaphobranchus kaupii TaxID=118154 RepID=A0A9Q1ELZ2_SYNKA|nr:hypothetical protein SKAU_G00335760 [Synaphobranchus kaupii]
MTRPGSAGALGVEARVSPPRGPRSLRRVFSLRALFCAGYLLSAGGFVCSSAAPREPGPSGRNEASPTGSGEVWRRGEVGVLRIQLCGRGPVYSHRRAAPQSRLSWRRVGAGVSEPAGVGGSRSREQPWKENKY